MENTHELLGMATLEIQRLRRENELLERDAANWRKLRDAVARIGGGVLETPENAADYLRRLTIQAMNRHECAFMTDIVIALCNAIDAEQE